MCILTMKNIAEFLKKKDLYLGIVRYILAGEMIGYGLLKIIGMQAVFVFPFSGWQHPLEAATGSQLTWAFIGYSSWFRVLLGLFEFLPAVLLLFRRTTLLGAILLLPMTLGVFLINQALDLWPYTKWLTTGLLLLNCFIFLFEWQRIKELAGIIIAHTGRMKWWVPEIILNILVVSIITWRIDYHSFYDKNEKNVLIGDWANHHPNEWNLINEKINDSTLPHHLMRSYYQPQSIYSEINDFTDNGKGYIKYSLDEKEHLLSFGFIRTEANLSNYYTLHGKFKYEVLGDTILQMEKVKDDTTLDKHTWTFKRRIINQNRFR